jgi:hypothetical protein
MIMVIVTVNEPTGEGFRGLFSVTRILGVDRQSGDAISVSRVLHGQPICNGCRDLPLPC